VSLCDLMFLRDSREVFVFEATEVCGKVVSGFRKEMLCSGHEEDGR
jgi:hypothetical protein